MGLAPSQGNGWVRFQPALSRKVGQISTGVDTCGPYWPMIGPAAGTRIFLACGHTDMRRGMDGLAALVQQAFGQDPFCGALYLFRGKRGRLIKCVWHDGQGLCLFVRRQII